MFGYFNKSTKKLSYSCTLSAIERGVEDNNVFEISLIENPEHGYCYEYIDGKIIKSIDEALEIERSIIQAEYEATEYQRLREAAYPKIGDQLDALYHYFEASNIANDFTDMIKAVKDRFPKPME